MLNQEIIKAIERYNCKSFIIEDNIITDGHYIKIIMNSEFRGIISINLLEEEINGEVIFNGDYFSCHLEPFTLMLSEFYNIDHKFFDNMRGELSLLNLKYFKMEIK